MVEAGVLANVYRGETIESVHYGHLVTLDHEGNLIGSIGDPTVMIYPRSSIKPIQAQAMVEAGLELDDEHLAAVCASHSGQDIHRRIATEILEKYGKSVDDLRNTPDYPISIEERVAGQGQTSLNQNCSGKHAGMIATCVINGWDTETYLDLDHPLQVKIRQTIAAWTGAADSPTIDGCGAPLFEVPIQGLARAFGKLVATNSPIARAMRAYPHVVGGEGGRDVTESMRAIPTLIAKDGAEGVYGAAFEGGSVAFKIGDGFGRPRPAILAAALKSLGVAEDKLTWGEVPVYGHGKIIGKVEACAPSSLA